MRAMRVDHAMLAGFLLGIGGGAALRRTCGLLLLKGWLWGNVFEARYGKLGNECVEAPEPERRRSLNASREPSEPSICCA